MDFAFNLTNNAHKTQIFSSAGAYTYNIPKGVTMVSILCLGAGGGGGGGQTRASGAGAGGGGGGTSGTARIIIPKIFLSNSLIVAIGQGGAGGGAGLAGSNGTVSSVYSNLDGTK